MPLENVLFHLEVSETYRDRQYWAKRAWSDVATAEAIRRADVIVVPSEDRETLTHVFPQGTADFFRSLAGDLPSLRVEIAAEKAGYAELTLHSLEKRWPKIFVSFVLLPIVANVLSDRIAKLINDQPSPTSVELELTVENERGKCISIKYKGPAETLVETIVTEAEKRCVTLDPKFVAGPQQ